MVTLMDLAKLYLMHVQVLGPLLGFRRGSQSCNCAENLLNDTVLVNHVLSLCVFFSSQLDSAFQIIGPTY